jgi:hypothetical protein
MSTVVVALALLCLAVASSGSGGGAHVVSIDEMNLWINESSTERAARFRTWSYVLGWQTFGGFNETYNMFPDADSFCDGLNCKEKKKKKKKIFFSLVCFQKKGRLRMQQIRRVRENLE